MFNIAALIVFLGVGLALWRAIVFLNTLYEEHVPDKYQERIYKTSKDLPKIVWAWTMTVVFWTSAGAMLLHITLGMFGGEKFLPATSWAPGIFFPLLLAIVCHFWESPHRAGLPAKSRGRKLLSSVDSSKKKPSPVTPSKRGRTIRSYRDIK